MKGKLQNNSIVRITNSYLWLGLIALLFVVSCNVKNERKVNVAVAANMQFAIDQLVEAFQNKHDIQVEISSASSGILATQIQQGAPFDIFLSADMTHPMMLYQENLTTSPPETYAVGKLILWSNEKKAFSSFELSMLTDQCINRIAIANPDTAPYGFMAQMALKNADIFEQMKSKLIIGESISQVNQYIQSNAVDVGITCKSVLSSPFVKNIGQWMELPDTLYKPIKQGIVILKHGQTKNSFNSEQFYKFMFSDEAKTILELNGYSIK